MRRPSIAATGGDGDHSDEFLHGGLLLPRDDRLAVPGSPPPRRSLRLVPREEALIEQLRFLVRVDGIERVILIAHQSIARSHRAAACLAAANRTHTPTTWRLPCSAISAVARGLTVETFFARKHADGIIRFESMKPVTC